MDETERYELKTIVAAGFVLAYVIHDRKTGRDTTMAKEDALRFIEEQEQKET